MTSEASHLFVCAMSGEVRDGDSRLCHLCGEMVPDAEADGPCSGIYEVAQCGSTRG